MKIEESVSKTTIIGDIKSNTVSIDVNSIGFITQMLSTNLYSRPMESFLREIVSNAWDSHVEAGNEDPILLEVGTNSENRHFIRIQDFGTGLSPQRFDEIYKMIGSSTKRDSNDYIGAFGIGRFSALAYSDTVYLTSNYEGVKYKYLMYKDGDNINIDELFNAPTVDHNGLEVMVYLRNSNDVYDISLAISSQLIYFDNLYLNFDRYNSYELDGFDDRFNNLKIKKYKTFSVNTMSRNEKSTILLGKVRYPLRQDVDYGVNLKYFNFSLPIAVCFEIGDLKITPNREAVQYTKETIESIGKKLLEVDKELKEIIFEQQNKDFDNFKDYVNHRLHSSNKIILYEDDFKEISFNFRYTHSNIKLNGVAYDENILEMWKFIRNGGNYHYNISLENEDVSFVVSNGRMQAKNPIPDGINIGKLINNMNVKTVESELDGIIYIANRGNLNTATRDYLREYAHDGTIFLKESFTFKKVVFEIMKILKNSQKNIHRTVSYKWNLKEFKIIVNYLAEEFSKIQKFTNEDVPQKYLDDRVIRMKAARENNRISVNWNQTVNLYVLRESQKADYNTDLNVTTDSKRLSLDDIKNNWKMFPVIYSFKDDILLRKMYWTFHNISNNYYGDYYKKHPFSKYRFVEIAPTRMKMLKEFPNFINIKDFMNVKYKKLREIATAKLIDERYPYLSNLKYNSDHLGEISKTLQKIVEKVYGYKRLNLPSGYYSSSMLTNEIYEMCKDHNYFDEEMLGYVNKNAKWLDNSKFISILSDNSRLPNSMINFIVQYILDKKLFMPDIEAVKKLREETIFNNPIKKEENENN